MTNGNNGMLLGGIALAVGIVFGYIIAGGNNASVGKPNPQERNLDALLYTQTAAEYRACCLQTYRLAGERLRTLLAARRAKGPLADWTTAVVMDLDETVLDNMVFNAWLYAKGKTFAPTLWQPYEADPSQVGLVPGALGFIELAESEKTSVVFISNRLEENKEKTIEALVRLGLSTRNIEQRLMLTRRPRPSDAKGLDLGNKEERRKKATQMYQVLLWVGDNLRDFDDRYRVNRRAVATKAEQNAALAKRASQVDEDAARWGNDWIILPNPVYGEWSQAINRAKPGENLRVWK